ncbi:MAG: MotA/TolQ/ExbB proton channel family protein [Verrucomicrobiales bacterium]|nr:MotA/TolQ/ExbB proton channel family protein [Verrucomicrobiales bacterium]
MISALSTATHVGSIQTALDQPLFPGKVLIWILLMLSIISWVKIVSKWLQLLKVNKADRLFSERLRQSRTTLELFEDGWHDEDSLQFLIYLAGARETAFQLLGSRAPVEGMEERVRHAGLLPAGKAKILDRAFESGFRLASMKAASGVGGLRFIGAAALFLGMIGSVWTLMDGFDHLEAGASLGPVLGSALGFVFISLTVATPAFLARIAFGIQTDKLEFGIAKFKEDIARLFERKFIDSSLMSRPSPPEGEPVSDEGDSQFGEDEEIFVKRPAPVSRELPITSHGKKQYHSIRERLLRPPSSDDDFNQLSVNPIARQTAGAKA